MVLGWDVVNAYRRFPTALHFLSRCQRFAFFPSGAGVFVISGRRLRVFSHPRVGFGLIFNRFTLFLRSEMLLCCNIE